MTATAAPRGNREDVHMDLASPIHVARARPDDPLQRRRPDRTHRRVDAEPREQVRNRTTPIHSPPENMDCCARTAHTGECRKGAHMSVLADVRPMTVSQVRERLQEILADLGKAGLTLADARSARDTLDATLRAELDEYEDFSLILS